MLSVLRQEARYFQLFVCFICNHDGTMCCGCLSIRSHCKRLVLEENVPVDSPKRGGTNYPGNISGRVSASSYPGTPDKGGQVTMKAEVKNRLTKLKLSYMRDEKENKEMCLCR